jgi:hypothetical protein
MNGTGTLTSDNQLTGVLSSSGTLTGRINGTGTLSGRLSNRSMLRGALSPAGNVFGRISGEQKLYGTIQPSTDTECHHKRYDGDYVVDPKAYEETVLKTNKKLMDNDVTVHEIPITIVTNIGGGATACIG